MAKIAEYWTRLKNLYTGKKTEIIAWYAANSTDSEDEDYVHPVDFTSITDIISLGDDLGDWFKLFLTWRNATTTDSKDDALTELESQVSDLYKQWGLDEDDLAVARLLTEKMFRILDQQSSIIDFFG